MIQAISGDVYEVPFSPALYRRLCFVSDDGVLLVEIKVHERAEEDDLVPSLRAWRERICVREKTARRGRLELLTSGDVGKGEAS